MPDYMVLFNPLTHTEDAYIPPTGIDGGIQGDTENGILAVYDVPDGLTETFEASISSCPTVLRFEVLPP